MSHPRDVASSTVMCASAYTMWPVRSKVAMQRLVTRDWTNIRVDVDAFIGNLSALAIVVPK